MSKRFYLLIEDDWELMGNGLGNVAELQYIPGHFLMKLARKHGIGVTFMVEVAQQLAFMRHTDKGNIRLQKRLWDDAVCLMKESGCDVQLHLHPQWLDAEYREDFFYLGKNWNIGTYSKQRQASLVSEGIAYLHNLLKPIDPNYKVHAFKAGSWALQPAESLLRIFSQVGIKIIMGVRKDLKIPSINVNYCELEEDSLPYHPDFEDIRKKAESPNDIVILPLAYYAPDLLTFGFYSARVLKLKLRSKDALDSYNAKCIPDQIQRSSPQDKEKLRFSMRPYLTHLKIGRESFGYLKTSFDNVIKRLRRHELPAIPIVIESHTKQYCNNYEDIDRFIGYVIDRYGHEAEFCDITSYLKVLEMNPQIIGVKRKHEFKPAGTVAN